MITASHGLNLRVDVRTEVDPISGLPSDFFIDLVCVGAGTFYPIASWVVSSDEAAKLAAEPATLAGFMAQNIGAAFR